MRRFPPLGPSGRFPTFIGTINALRLLTNHFTSLRFPSLGNTTPTILGFFATHPGGLSSLMRLGIYSGAGYPIRQSQGWNPWDLTCSCTTHFFLCPALRPRREYVN